jgi:hypothetical protein
LKDRYHVYEQEAATHYKRITQEMRIKAKKQLTDQEEICTQYKQKINENNITITLLQTRVDELMRDIEDKKREA